VGEFILKLLKLKPDFRKAVAQDMASDAFLKSGLLRRLAALLWMGNSRA